jgi:hypothetical protein
MVRERVRAVLELEREVVRAARADAMARAHDDAMLAAVRVAVRREHGGVALVRVRRERVVECEVEVRDELDADQPQDDRAKRERASYPAASHPG